MVKYIDRKAVLSILIGKNAPWNAYEKIAALPAADVQPVKHGRWICHDDEILGFTTECSVCHVEGCLDGYYCPNCGAKMDGET